LVAPNYKNRKMVKSAWNQGRNVNLLFSKKRYCGAKAFISRKYYFAGGRNIISQR